DAIAVRSRDDVDAVAVVGPLVAVIDDLVALDEVVAGLGDFDGVAPGGGVAALGEIRAAHDIVVGARANLDGIANDVLDAESLHHDVASGIEPHRNAEAPAVQHRRLPGIAPE